MEYKKKKSIKVDLKACWRLRTNRRTSALLLFPLYVRVLRGERSKHDDERYFVFIFFFFQLYPAGRSRALRALRSALLLCIIHSHFIIVSSSASSSAIAFCSQIIINATLSRPSALAGKKARYYHFMKRRKTINGTRTTLILGRFANDPSSDIS